MAVKTERHTLTLPLQALTIFNTPQPTVVAVEIKRTPISISHNHQSAVPGGKREEALRHASLRAAVSPTVF